MTIFFQEKHAEIQNSALDCPVIWGRLCFLDEGGGVGCYAFAATGEAETL